MTVLFVPDSLSGAGGKMKGWLVVVVVIWERVGAGEEVEVGCERNCMGEQTYLLCFSSQRSICITADPANSLPQELSSKRNPSPSLSQTQDVFAWYAGWIVDLNDPLKFITGE